MLLNCLRHTLKNRVMFAIDRQQSRPRPLNGLHEQATAGHQRFFIRQQHGFPGADRRKRRYQPRRADDCRHHLIDLIQRRDLSRRLLAAQHLGTAAMLMQTGAQPLSALRIIHHGVTRSKFQALFNHAVNVFPRDQRGDGKATRVMAYHVQRATANGAGRTENG